MSIKASILVPICNVEKFLDKCLQSLIEQTLQDIEIICINDGSKDNSLAIIEKFAESDSRIVIIDKPNSGYGDSMNKGLEIAQGEYVGIVESDDFVDRDMFYELYDLAVKNNADVVKSNFNFYWENPKKIIRCNNMNVDNIYVNDKLNREKLFYGMPAIWSAIYKKEWLENNGIKFLPTPGASYQDTSFNFKVACMAEKIVLTPKAYLYYRQDNANSSVKNASVEKAKLLHKEWQEAERFIVKKNLQNFLMYYNTLKFNGYMWNYGRISKNDRVEYFDTLKKEFVKPIKEQLIDMNHIQRICKYGGCYAIENNRKYVLDFLFWLRTCVVSNEV